MNTKTKVHVEVTGPKPVSDDGSARVSHHEFTETEHLAVTVDVWDFEHSTGEVLHVNAHPEPGEQVRVAPGHAPRDYVCVTVGRTKLFVSPAQAREIRDGLTKSLRAFR